MNHVSEGEATEREPRQDSTSPPKGPSALQQRRAARIWRRPVGWMLGNTYAPSWLPVRLCHPALGYVAAVLLEGLAVALTLLLRASVMGFGLETVLVLPTVAIAALIWGRGPSLLATLVGGVLLWFFIFSPPFSWTLAPGAEVISLGLVLGMGVLISLIAGKVGQAQHQAEQARRAAEAQAEQQHTTFEALVDSLFVFDQGGRLLQQNHAAHALLGLDLASSLAPGTQVEQVRQLAPRDERGQPLTLEQTMVNRVLRGEVVRGGSAQDVWVRTREGQEVLLSVTGAPIRNQQGQISGAVMLARDITERHQLEQALSAQTRELEAILDTMTDSVTVFDAAGQDLRLNPAARALRQRSLSTADLAAPLLERAALVQATDEAGEPSPPERHPPVRVLRGETLSGASSVDIVLLTLDGEPLSLNITGAPLRDKTGQQVGGVLVARDVTERRQLEQRTQQALAALIDLAHALVATPTPAAVLPGLLAERLAAFTTQVLGAERVLLVQRDAETGLLHPLVAGGLSPEQERRWRASLEDRPLGAWWGPAVAARLEAGEVVHIAETGAARVHEPLFGSQRRLLAPLRGEHRLIGVLAVGRSGSAPPFTPQEEALLGAVAKLCTLVLERERLLFEREAAHAQVLALEDAKQQMETFLALAGNELKIPLTGLRLGFDLIKRHTLRRRPDAPDTIQWVHAPPPQALQHLVLWEQQFKRMEQLVGDLLEVSSIQAGQLALHPELVDLVALVWQAVEEQQEAQPHRTILLQLPATKRFLLEVDAPRLGQVVTHYLTNALTYSPADQPVEVGLKVDDPQVRVWVQDHGPGIPEAWQAHIWERFSHVPGVAPPSGAGVGLGLGLYLCRSIIERHGGQVGVQSVPEAGATFWFTLPLQSPEEPAQEGAG